MTTVNESKLPGASPTQNSYAWPAGNFFVNAPGPRSKPALSPWTTAGLRPTIERTVSTDEKKVRAGNISKYSNCGLESNAFISSMKTEIDIERPNTAVDDRSVVYVIDDDS
jgi:hypothetical protein